MNVTGREIDIWARTLYGEVRGEPWDGKVAVAWTIRNRVEKPGWWGRDIVGVCQKPWQFSCWNEKDPNRAQLLAVTVKHPVFRECLAAVAAVAGDLAPDPTKRSTHYYASYIPEPEWAKGKNPAIVIGTHRFFNDVK